MDAWRFEIGLDSALDFKNTKGVWEYVTVEEVSEYGTEIKIQASSGTDIILLLFFLNHEINI